MFARKKVLSCDRLFFKGARASQKQWNSNQIINTSVLENVTVLQIANNSSQFACDMMNVRYYNIILVTFHWFSAIFVSQAMLI